VFWIVVLCLCSDRSQFMSLFMVLNLCVGPGFIFESVVNFSIAIFLLLAWTRSVLGCISWQVTVSMVPNDWEYRHLRGYQVRCFFAWKRKQLGSEMSCYFKKLGNGKSHEREDFVKYHHWCSVLSFICMWQIGNAGLVSVQSCLFSASCANLRQSSIFMCQL